MVRHLWESEELLTPFIGAVYSIVRDGVETFPQKKKASFWVDKVRPYLEMDDAWVDLVAITGSKSWRNDMSNKLEKYCKDVVKVASTHLGRNLTGHDDSNSLLTNTKKGIKPLEGYQQKWIHGDGKETLKFLVDCWKSSIEASRIESDSKKIIKRSKDAAKEAVQASLNISGRGKVVENGKRKRLKRAGLISKTEITKKFVELNGEGVDISPGKLRNIIQVSKTVNDLLGQCRQYDASLQLKKVLKPKPRGEFVVFCDELSRATSAVSLVSIELKKNFDGLDELRKKYHRKEETQMVDMKAAISILHGCMRDLVRAQNQLEEVRLDEKMKKMLEKTTSPKSKKHKPRAKKTKGFSPGKTFL